MRLTLRSLPRDLSFSQKVQHHRFLPVVPAVVPGSRAAKAGTRYGDRLVSIDGQDVGGTTERDPGLLIPGPIGGPLNRFCERVSQEMMGWETACTP